MARENQGLQIALSVFVILTILLGVMAFFFYKQYEEADKMARKSQEEARTDRGALEEVQEENNELKQLVGFPATARFDEIEEKFEKDMAKYASTYPEEARFYSTVLPYLFNTIEDKLNEIESNKAEIGALKQTNKTRERIKQKQIDSFRNEALTADQDSKKRAAEFNKFEQTMRDETQAIKADIAKAQREDTVERQKDKKDLKAAETQTRKLAADNRVLSKKLEDTKRDTFEVPDGEVRWVDQHTRTVWINLGRSDALPRRANFRVYPADMADMATGKKATIEVTQILGPSRAQARIVEDSLSDPIMPGDKIYTPGWTPGQQRRFALAGFMDIDGDGVSDRQTVHNLITMSGGIIDCETKDNGKVSGQMSVNTRYLVRGHIPEGQKENVKGLRDAYDRLVAEAKRLGVKTISLDDLLREMDYKKQSPVVRFGEGADSADNRPAFSGAPFRERRPPASSRVGRGSAY